MHRMIGDGKEAERRLEEIEDKMMPPSSQTTESVWREVMHLPEGAVAGPSNRGITITS